MPARSYNVGAEQKGKVYKFCVQSRTVVELTLSEKMGYLFSLSIKEESGLPSIPMYSPETSLNNGTVHV